MATYNFAKSKTNLDDTHTNMRLKEQHSEAPETVTEKQLAKKDREDKNPDVITEALLEKARTGGAEVILEKNLNDSKGMFGSKHRNSEAYTGDINKLEEKRLSAKKQEDEKYKPASETSKQLKWWEGLKKANSNKVVKTAQEEEGGDPFDPSARFERIKDYDPDTEGIMPDTDAIPDLSNEAEQIGEEDLENEVKHDPSRKMFVTKNKDGQSPIPHVYMELSFDPSLFKSDDEAKEAAMEKVLEVRPNLAGKIDISDFTDPERGALDATVKLRLLGEEYFAVEEEASPFLNVETEDVDVGGTPMTVGKVTLGPQAEAMDENLVQEVRDYIAEKTGIEVPESAIQVNLEKGEVNFAFDPTNPEEPVGTTTPETGTEVAEDLGDLGETEGPEGDNEIFDIIDDETPEAPEMPEAPPVPVEEKKAPAMAKSIYDFPIVVADSKKK